MFEKDAESQCTEANIQTPVQSFLMAEDGIQLTIGASFPSFAIPANVF